MARIKIEMIKKFAFETQLVVRITDINYGNHVGSDAFISLLHEARVRFLANLGFTETDIGGAALMISDLAVIYKSQAFCGDILTFEIGAGDFNKYGCDLFYRVTHTKTGNLVVLAKTGIVFFDIAGNTLINPPAVFSSVVYRNGL